MPDLVFTSKGSAEVLRQQTLLNEKAAEMAQIYKDDARAARELESAVGRIFKSVKDPSKAFNEEMGKILRNFKDGKINAEQYDKAIKRLEGAYRDANSFGGKLRGTLQNMFGSENLKKLQNYALGLTGAGGLIAAVALLKSEYEAVIKLQDEATKTKLDVSQARNLVIRNMLGESPATIQGTLAKTSALAGELKLPETVIAAALAEALSASGGKQDPAFAAVRLAGQYLPDQPGEIGAMAGSLLDMQKATGNADPRVNFGLIARIGQLSRLPTAQAIAANAPKALIGSAGFGATTQEGAALYSTLTQMFDPEGRAAATAQTQFAKQLFFFDENMRKTAPGLKPLTAAQRKKLTPAELQARLTAESEVAARQAEINAKADQFKSLTMGGKIAFLQNDPEMANYFLRGLPGPGGFPAASFESQFVAPFRGLLLGGEKGVEMQRMYQGYYSQIGSEHDMARLAGEAINNFNLNPINSQANVERSLQSFNERLSLQMPDTLSEEGRVALGKIQQKLGGTQLGTRFRQLLAQSRDGAIGMSASDTLSIVEEEQARLLKGREYNYASSGPFGAQTNTAFAPATVEDKENAKLLGELATLLKQQIEQQKETNRKLTNSGIPVTNN